MNLVHRNTKKSIWRRELDVSWVATVRRLGLDVLWPASSIVALLALFPWPVPQASIDDSCLLLLHRSFGAEWVFGRDLISMWGPWGFLYGGFLPETRQLVIVSWAVLSQLLLLGIIVAVRPHASGYRGLIVCWSVLAIIALAQPDVKMIAFAAVLFAVGLSRSDDTKTRLAEGALALGIGWLASVKFTMVLVAAPLLGAHALQIWLDRRRLSPAIPLFLVSLLAARRVAGQPLSALWDWWSSSLLIVAGHATGARTAPWYQQVHSPWWYVSGALALMLVMSLILVRRRGWMALLPLASLSALLAVLMKASYVRHDTGHHATAPLTFLALVLLVAPFMIRQSERHERMLFLGVVLIAIASAHALTMLEFRRSLPVALEEHVESIAENVRNLPERERAAVALHHRKMDSIRETYPLPERTSEPVDVYPYRLAVPLAHELTLTPRPAFQSHLACPLPLAEANARHLTGASAPATVLLGVEPIDERFPTLEDGLSYATLLAHYEPVGETNGFLVLGKRPEPRRVTFHPLGTLRSSLGRGMALPQTTGPVWAVVRTEFTLLGRLRRLVLRAPSLFLLATTASGQAKYRFVQEFGEMGFMLSPVPVDHRDLRPLFDGAAVENRRLHGFSITTGSAEDDARFFKTEMTVELWELRVEEEGPEMAPSPERSSGNEQMPVTWAS
jgi:hypothetical protein